MFVYIYIDSNPFGQNLGKSGNHGSGIEEKFFQADAGAIFRHLRQQVGNGRGGGDYETYVHLHGVLKRIAISLFVPVSLDDCFFAEGSGKGLGFRVWELGFFLGLGLRVRER